MQEQNRREVVRIDLTRDPHGVREQTPKMPLGEPPEARGERAAARKVLEHDEKVHCGNRKPGGGNRQTDSDLTPPPPVPQPKTPDDETNLLLTQHPRLRR